MITIFLIIIFLIALVYLIFGFFELIELADDAATGENSLNQKRFFKKLLIISFIIGAGILFEYEYLNEFGIFFQIGLYIWGTIFIMAPFILIPKWSKTLKELIKKIKNNKGN